VSSYLDTFAYSVKVSGTAQAIRDGARRQLREALLDAASDLVAERGWQRVRMGQVAAAVGVSRQTAHTELGTKEALGQALVFREAERFLTGVSRVLEEHRDSPGRAVAAAVRFALSEGARNPLLRTILTAARDGDDSLLPLLTTRSQPLLEAASGVVGAAVLEAYPDLDPVEVADVVDSLVRLTVSHLVVPVGTPEDVSERLAKLALRGLRIEDVADLASPFRDLG
jgi:AcrR family transcriptional regulator